MNRQAFELLILGSASASPTSDRNPSAQLLNIAERYFLIDCGEATQIQLRRYRSKFQSIDHIFISHLHGDHFFGLPGFLSSMSLLGRRQPLNIYAPKKLKELIDNIVSVTETWLSYTINWVFTDFNSYSLIFEDEKVEVYCFPLKHRIFCTGFLFREKPLMRKINKTLLEELDISFADIMRLKNGYDVTNKKGESIKNADATLDPPPPRSYAYCSDTIADESVIEYVKNTDLLYHESTFLEDNLSRAEKTFHSTARQAAEIAKAANVNKLLLGHFSARYQNLQAFIDEAAPIFENCELATDGKKIEI